eukprot:3032948-Rhodomonas_salina.4
MRRPRVPGHTCNRRLGVNTSVFAWGVRVPSQIVENRRGSYPGTRVKKEICAAQVCNKFGKERIHTCDLRRDFPPCKSVTLLESDCDLQPQM